MPAAPVEIDPALGEPALVISVVIYPKELQLEMRHAGRRYVLRKAWDVLEVQPLDAARYALHAALETLHGIDGRQVYGDPTLMAECLFDEPLDLKEVT